MKKLATRIRLLSANCSKGLGQRSLPDGMLVMVAGAQPRLKS